MEAQVWIRWKRKRSYRMREICLLMLFMSLQVRLRPQLLRTLYTILLPKKTICTINLHIGHDGVLISFLYLLFFGLCQNVTGQAAQLPCHQLQLGSHPLGFYGCIFNFLLFVSIFLPFLANPFLSFEFSLSFLCFYGCQAAAHFKFFLWGQL